MEMLSTGEEKSVYATCLFTVFSGSAILIDERVGHIQNVQLLEKEKNQC